MFGRPALSVSRGLTHKVQTEPQRI